MELSFTREIAAPRAQVFAALSDFEGLESALRRSIPDLTREAGGGPFAAGTVWQGTAHFHGLSATSTIRLAEIDPPQGYALSGLAEGVLAAATLALEEPMPGATLLLLRCDLKPNGLRGRIVIQSLRLLRPKIEAKVEERLARFAARQERAARSAPWA